MRVIKIITRNNEQFNIEINSKEFEVRDLISSITGLNGKEILGICDKYGNYYTLSFAVNNHCINNDLSEYYFLITNINSENYNKSHNKNPFYSNSPSGKQSHKRSNKKEEKKQKSENGTYSYRQNIRQQEDRFEPVFNYNDPYVFNNSPRLNKINQFNQVHFPSQNNNYNSSRDRLNNDLQKVKDDFIGQSDNEMSEEIEKYLSIINDFLNNNLISQISAIRIQKMILEEKVHLINNFKNFITGRLNLKDFVQNLEDNLIEDNIKLEANLNSRPRTPVPIKKNLIRFLEELPSTIFDDIKNDHALILSLAKQPYNEIINSAYEVYLADDDFENFGDSLKMIINHHKDEKKNDIISKIISNYIRKERRGRLQ